MGERQGMETYGVSKSYDTEIANLARMVHGMGERVGHVSRRIDALTLTVNDHAGHIEDIDGRLLLAPKPAEPTPAPETPDALAKRLLNDPETLAAVIISVAAQSRAIDRQSLHDEIQKSEREIPAGAHAHCLRLLAATIAAASFGK